MVKWCILNIFQVTYQSEALVLGVERRQLKRALFINWLMRHYREYRGLHVMEMTDTVIDEAVNHLRRDGLPEMRHSCGTTGPAHVRHLMKKNTEAQVDRLLRAFEGVIVMDGHEKLNRTVCQHNAGARELHPHSGLKLSVQCPGMQRNVCICNPPFPATPCRDSGFCKEHGGDVEDDSSDDEPIASRTRTKGEAQKLVSPSGCEKIFMAHRNHTTGLACKCE